MSFAERTAVRMDDSFSIDGFGRQRTSEPFTLFDSKQLYDKAPLFYDEETSDGTETSEHSRANASVAMTVNLTGEYVIRQSKMRMNYQPGKSQEILLTFNLGPTTTNVTKRVGYFNTSTVAPYSANIDGVYLEDDGTGLHLCVAKDGSVNKIAQSDWNFDKFDGTGPSKIALDISKTQILFIDLEWLGVGRVRAGFVIDGKIYYANYFNHANIEENVYMSSPNHSMRYEIRSNGGTGSMQHICSSVISEGGLDENGINLSYNTGILTADAIDVSGNTSEYALLGFRLKQDRLDCTAILKKFYIFAATNSTFRWSILLNPTVSGTFVYSDITNSSIQIAKGDIANDPSNSIVTGGTLIDTGYVSTEFSSGGSLAVKTIDTALNVGSSIAGARDEIVICVHQFGTGGEDYHASITWKELL